jgi:hypothetical protein
MSSGGLPPKSKPAVGVLRYQWLGFCQLALSAGAAAVDPLVSSLGFGQVDDLRNVAARSGAVDCRFGAGVVLGSSKLPISKRLLAIHPQR